MRDLAGCLLTPLVFFGPLVVWWFVKGRDEWDEYAYDTEAGLVCPECAPFVEGEVVGMGVEGWDTGYECVECGETII